MQAIKSELLELLRRNDLLKAALTVGKIQSTEFHTAAYVEKVLELSAAVWNSRPRLKKDPILIAQHINQVLYKDYGLEGKSERSKHIIDDPHRYYIHSVMDKKVGSPLALTILYSIVAEQIGLSHEVLAFPSYFLLRVSDVATDFYIDPYESGKFLTQEEFQKKFRMAMHRNRMLSTNLFEKVTATHLVARLVQQLKHVYILKGSSVEALRAVEMLTAIYPESPELARDRGILYCEMEYFSRAVKDLKCYLKQRPNADDVAEIKKLATMLKGYREVIN